LTILTTLTLASTNNVLPDDGVTAPKHVRAVLMLILKLFFKTIHLRISWWIKKTLIISRRTVCMWKNWDGHLNF